MAPGNPRRIHVEGQSTWQPAGRPTLGHQAHGVAPTHGSEAPPPTAEASQRLERERADLRRRVTSMIGRHRAAEGSFEDLVARTSADDEQRVSDARSRAVALAQQEAHRVSLAAEAASGRLAAELSSLTSRLAPGWGSAPLTGDWALPDIPIPGPAVRLGTHVGGSLEGVAALVQVLDCPGLSVSADSVEDIAAAMRIIVTRVVAQASLKHVRVEVFDPKLRGVLGGLTGLRNVFGSSFPLPSVDASSFVRRLDAVTETAVRNVELARADGFSTLTDLWRDRGVPEGVLQLIVVLDYPYGVDRALQASLSRLAGFGGASGTVLLVGCDPQQRPDSEVIPRELLARLSELTIEEGTISSACVQGAARLDGDVAASFMASLVTGAADATRAMRGPVIKLIDLMTDVLDHPWTGSSADSLDVVIGKVGQLPLQLSFRTENPPLPNLLLGGAVGQGKSNLLLDIIYGLAATYSPQELELFLLDFKRGMEFKRFGEDADGRNWLPHAKVLSLESNQEFGVAVLAHVEEEMERRSLRFKSVGATSLDAYRRLTDETMPRLLLVIDEFHMLFEGEDRFVEQSIESMERLAKQGRAYGIHLLLASQTTSGVRGLAVKGDSIFAQFPMRLSLKNTPAESQAILSEGNKAAAELTYRGEVIVNSNFGADQDGANVRAMSAFADPDDVLALQRRLWAMGHGDPPMVFVGGEFSAWEPARDHLEPPASGTLRMALGRPIRVTRAPVTLLVEQDADQATAVVGPEAATAVAALSSMVGSCVPTLAERAGRIIVLDALGGRQPWIESLVSDAARVGLPCDVVGREHIARSLVEDVAPLLDASGSTCLVVGLGLQRVRGMDAATAGDVDSFNFTFETAAETPRTILGRLAREGAIAGVSFIGWWPNVRTLEADLGMRHDGVARYVTAGLGRDDLKSLAGPMANPIEGSPRVGLFDRSGDGALQTVVPFAPMSFGTHRQSTGVVVQ